jgi:hypothetical protein
LQQEIVVSVIPAAVVVTNIAVAVTAGQGFAAKFADSVAKGRLRREKPVGRARC